MICYSQGHDDDNRETAEEGNASNDTLSLVSDLPTGAGGGEVKDVSRGAGLDGVEGAVAVAGIRVPDLVGLDALRPVLGVVTDTPAHHTQSQSQPASDSPAGGLVIELQAVAVGGRQLAAAHAGLVNLHTDLATPDIVLAVRPLGQDQHHLHLEERALVGEAAVGRGIAGPPTPLHYHVVRHNLNNNYR